MVRGKEREAILGQRKKEERRKKKKKVTAFV